MIKNRKSRIVADPRGKITTGQRAESGLPQSLDYFNIDKFPELIEMYGDKPTELIIFFPSNEIEDFFDDTYCLWGKNQAKVRSCDGEVCIHRVNEEIEGNSYVAGEETECVCSTLDLPLKHKKRCRYDMYLKAYIVNPQTERVRNPLPYSFSNHSVNSGANIYSALKAFLEIPGASLRGVPFKLAVKMVKGVDRDRFPIWNLYPITFLKQIKGVDEQHLIESAVSEDTANQVDEVEATVEADARKSEAKDAIESDELTVAGVLHAGIGSLVNPSSKDIVKIGHKINEAYQKDAITKEQRQDLFKKLNELK